jgi:hypothetical protein
MEEWNESSGERIGLRLNAKTFCPFHGDSPRGERDWNLTPAAVYQNGVLLGFFGHRHSPTGTAGVIRPDKGGELGSFFGPNLSRLAPPG